MKGLTPGGSVFPSITDRFNRLTTATRQRIRREELNCIRTVEVPDWTGQMTVECWPHLPHTLGSGGAT